MSGGGQGGYGGFGQQSMGGYGQGYGGFNRGGYGNKMGYGGQQSYGQGQQFGGGNPWMRQGQSGLGNPGYGNFSQAGQPGGFGRSVGSGFGQENMGRFGQLSGMTPQPMMFDPSNGPARQTGGVNIETQPPSLLTQPSIGGPGQGGPSATPPGYSPLSGPDASQPGQPGKIGMMGNPSFTGNSPNGLNYSGSAAPGAGWQEMLRQYAMRDNQANMNQYAQDRNMTPMWGNQLQPWEYNGRG